MKHSAGLGFSQSCRKFSTNCSCVQEAEHDGVASIVNQIKVHRTLDIRKASFVCKWKDKILWNFNCRRLGLRERNGWGSFWWSRGFGFANRIVTFDTARMNALENNANCVKDQSSWGVTNAAAYDGGATVCVTSTSASEKMILSTEIFSKWLNVECNARVIENNRKMIFSLAASFN